MIIILGLVIVVSSLQANAAALLHPKMVIFDIEYTLWEGGTNITLPIRKKRNGIVIDSSQSIITPLPDSLSVLKLLWEYRIPMSIVSNNTNVELIKELIECFGWSIYFQCTEIFPGLIDQHLKKLRKDTKINFEHMIFFGHNSYNVNIGKSLGILSLYGKYGVRWIDVMDGLLEYQKPKTNNMSNVVSITSGIRKGS